MSVFAVVLREPNEEVRNRLKAEYPGHYRLSPTFALVPADEVSEDIAIKVGIKGDERARNVSGVVFKLQDAWSGYTTQSLWEWLKSHREEF